MSFIHFAKHAGQLHVTIETERLYLESVTAKFLPDYSKMFSDPEVMKTFSTGKPWEEEVIHVTFDGWVTRWKQDDPFSSLCVSKNDDDSQFIGHVVLGHGEKPGQSELAYVLNKLKWGQGYGKEAVHAVVRDYAPALARRNYTLAGEIFTSISATALETNTASIKILENAGLKKVDRLFKHDGKRFVFFANVSDLNNSSNTAEVEKNSPKMKYK